MGLVHTQGVVLRHTNIKESDRMLTVFSPSHGKLSVLAKGCRKPKSRFLSISQPFCYGDIVLKQYRDIYILTQAEVINSYFDLRSDLERLSLASYLLHITEDAISSGDDNPQLFTLLLKALSLMSFGQSNPLDIVLIYELKLLDCLGYRPSLDRCVVCEQDVGGSNSFSLAGGLVCGNCNGQAGDLLLDPVTLNAMAIILDMDIGQLAKQKLMAGVRGQLNKLMPAYIREKLEKEYPSRDFIDRFLTQHA